MIKLIEYLKNVFCTRQWNNRDGCYCANNRSKQARINENTKNEYATNNGSVQQCKNSLGGKFQYLSLSNSLRVQDQSLNRMHVKRKEVVGSFIETSYACSDHCWRYTR